GVNASEAAQRTHIIPVKSMTASEMATIVKEVFREATGDATRRGGGGGGINPFNPFAAAFGGGRQQPTESRPAQLTVSTNERTNSLILLCSDTMAKDIRALVDELEQAPST